MASDLRQRRPRDARDGAVHVARLPHAARHDVLRVVRVVEVEFASQLRRVLLRRRRLAPVARLHVDHSRAHQCEDPETQQLQERQHQIVVVQSRLAQLVCSARTKSKQEELY